MYRELFFDASALSQSVMQIYKLRKMELGT